MQFRAMLGELGMPSIWSLLPIPRAGTALAEHGTPQQPHFERAIERLFNGMAWYATALGRQRAEGKPFPAPLDLASEERDPDDQDGRCDRGGALKAIHPTGLGGAECSEQALLRGRARTPVSRQRARRSGPDLQDWCRCPGSSVTAAGSAAIAASYRGDHISAFPPRPRRWCDRWRTGPDGRD